MDAREAVEWSRVASESTKGADPCHGVSFATAVLPSKGSRRRRQHYHGARQRWHGASLRRAGPDGIDGMAPSHLTPFSISPFCHL